jgi:hypothetical protein
MTARRLAPPWSVEELDACYLVRDHNSQQFAHVYFEDERDGARNHAPIHRDLGHRALAEAVLSAS